MSQLLCTVAEIHAELGRLREEAEASGTPLATTSVLTLVAWVPPSWRAAADRTLEGLARGHPSRAILLMPREVDAPVNGAGGERPWSARVSLRTMADSPIAAEVIELDLPPRATGAASIVTPLLRSDLPVFLRWRGELASGSEPFDPLIGLADRLIVDSGEWPDAVSGYEALVDCLERAAVSDLAWRRLEPWRRSIAARWHPEQAIERVRVVGPEIEARLLGAWLGSRLGQAVALEQSQADQLAAVALDGDEIPLPRFARRSGSELLSIDLEQVRRDPIFEEAACALSSVTT